MWSDYFPDKLPNFKHHNFIGLSGIDGWLSGGANSPFLADVIKIWPDFVEVFKQRSNDGTENIPADTTDELLFVSQTRQYFDLIYSKHGYKKGKHWFFHWTSDVGNPVGAKPSPPRQGIDVLSDDEDGESNDND
jgi:hypothetical protein